MVITDMLLDVNKYSRPLIHRNKITKIVVHYVGNPKSTAKANRNYFNNLKGAYASSHYIVGLDGEVIRCVPDNEIAYHGNKENTESIGVEFCHHDESGQPSSLTYTSLVELLSYLCNKYNLDARTSIIRHYDCKGSNNKCCPKYYVEHYDEWETLKDDVFKHNKPNIRLTLEVENINANGYHLSGLWENTNTMQLKYVPELIKRFGGINFLCSAKVITDRDKWAKEKYTYKDVASLIIKFSLYLDTIHAQK